MTRGQEVRVRESCTGITEEPEDTVHADADQQGVVVSHRL